MVFHLKNKFTRAAQGVAGDAFRIEPWIHRPGRRAYSEDYSTEKMVCKVQFEIFYEFCQD